MTKEKAQARREHLQKMRAQQQRKERRTALLMWGSGGLVVVLLVGLVGYYLIEQSRVTSLDGVTSVAHQLGYFETVAGPGYLETIEPGIESVTVEQVGEAARTWLEARTRTVGWFRPISSRS